MNQPKILVFAYSEVGYACLQELIHQQANIIGVFTHEDNPNENTWFHSVASLAEKHAIPTYYEAANSPEGEKIINDLHPDLLLSFYYRLMIPESILKLAPLGAFNMHGSLLPKYRGRAPINWAILHGEKETGVTLHVMVKKPDAGDIVDQESVSIESTDTAHTVFMKIVPAAQAVIKRQLPDLLKGCAKLTPQDHSQATYFSGRKPEDGLIDWRQNSESIFNLIRAVTTPYPGAFTYYQGRKILIWWATPVIAEGVPGKIINTAPLIVGTGNGALLIEKWEWVTKKLPTLTTGESLG